MNVDAEDESNETCLYYCVLHENIQCFEYLITLVSDPDIEMLREEVNTYVKEPKKGLFLKALDC